MAHFSLTLVILLLMRSWSPGRKRVIEAIIWHQGSIDEVLLSPQRDYFLVQFIQRTYSVLY